MVNYIPENFPREKTRFDVWGEGSYGSEIWQKYAPMLRMALTSEQRWEVIAVMGRELGDTLANLDSEKSRCTTPWPGYWVAERKRLARLDRQDRKRNRKVA